VFQPMGLCLLGDLWLFILGKRAACYGLIKGEGMTVNSHRVPCRVCAWLHNIYDGPCCRSFITGCRAAGQLRNDKSEYESFVYGPLPGSRVCSFM
jgi:hypothetical protein